MHSYYGIKDRKAPAERGNLNKHLSKVKPNNKFKIRLNNSTKGQKDTWKRTRI